MLNIIFPQDTIFKMEQCTVPSQELNFSVHNHILVHFCFQLVLQRNTRESDIEEEHEEGKAKQKGFVVHFKVF